MWKGWIAMPLLLLATSANAEMVETDWHVERDRLAMLDTDTGIEWLSVSQTEGMSIAQVRSELGEGGLFAGWRFPSSEEIADMLIHALDGSDGYQVASNVDREWDDGDNRRVDIGKTTSYASRARELMFGHLGITRVAGQSNSTVYELHARSEIDDQGTVAQLDMSFKDYTASSYTDSWGVFLSESTSSSLQNHISEDIGILLVSDGGVTLSSIRDPSLNAMNPDSPYNNVPAPGLALVGLSLLGLSMRHHRRREEDWERLV